MSVYKYAAKTGIKGIKWGYSIYLGNNNRLVRSGFARRSDAKREERLMRNRLEFMPERSSLNLTLEDAFELMKAKRRDVGDISVATETNYNYDFQKLFPDESSLPASTKLRVIKPARLQRRLDEVVMQVQGKRQLKFLRTFCRWMYSQQLVDTNLATGLVIKRGIKKTSSAEERVKKSESKRNWLDNEEFVQFNSLLDGWQQLDKQDYLLIKMGVNSGLRSGELRGLQVKDIETTPNGIFLNVDKQFTSQNKYGPTKNRKLRKVPVSPELSKLINDYLNSYKKSLYKRTGWKLTKDSPLFTMSPRLSNNEERPIAVGHLQDVLRKFYRHFGDTGINRITPHGLRHTYASMLYNVNNLPVDQISLLLGHDSVSTTLDYYIHTFGVKFTEIQQALYSGRSES